VSRKITFVVVTLCFVSILMPFAAYASGADYEYPELMVTPRASDRISQEAKQEAATKWTRHIPIQASALMTLVAGAIQFSAKDPGKDAEGRSPLFGIGAGGAWLVTSFLLSAYYNPYDSAQKSLAGMPARTQREQLTRERYAEEAIESAACLGRRLMWLSFMTNAGASAWMLSKATSGSMGMFVDIAAIAMAVTPVFFQYRWQSVAAEQRSYKKRIYGPVAAPLFLQDPASGKVGTGVSLTLAFN